MAWGTKYIKFSSGDKVKVGNSVLEAVKSAIIRDYKKATSKSNQEGDPENRIRIFSKNTYLKWLRVISMINHTRWIFCYSFIQVVRWTKSAALAGLDSYSATGYVIFKIQFDSKGLCAVLMPWTLLRGLLTNLRPLILQRRS